MLTPVHHQKHLQWAREHQSWTLELKVVIGSNEPRHRDGGGGNVVVGNPWSGYQFNTRHLPRLYYGPGTPGFQHSATLQMLYDNDPRNRKSSRRLPWSPNPPDPDPIEQS